MTNPAHIIETALLLLVAYVLGCVVGYGARRVIAASTGTPRQPITASVAPSSLPPRSLTPAAKLARAASADEMPAPLPAPAAKPVVAAPKPVAKPKPKPKPKVGDAKPAALAAPRNGNRDDLKQIKGIGPKIEASLNGLGIYHFDQLAGFTKPNVEWVEGHLAFKGRIGREKWIEQAKALARA